MAKKTPPAKPAAKAAGKAQVPAKPAAKPAVKAAAAKPAAKAAAAKPSPAKPAASKVVSKAGSKPNPKAPAAKLEQKKVEQKKVDPKKADPKKVETKKAEPKKAEATKVEAKKVDPKKPDPKKVEAKAPVAAKVDPKKAAAKPEAKVPAKQPEAKKADAKKVDPKKPESTKAEAKADGKSKGRLPGDPLEPPTVPKKGPIDLAQHKSVAAVAAALVNARGDQSNFIMINGRRVRVMSTKGISIAKKPKSTEKEAAPAPTEQQIRSIKTKLGKKELDEYRALLLAKRRQLVGMLSGMEDEALRSSGGNLSNMPVHMADMGSDVYEQDFTLGMAETERAILDEIDAALQRIEDKTFGVCQMTGKPIAKARLDAKPWAKYTIEAERIAETGGGR